MSLKFEFPWDETSRIRKKNLIADQQAIIINQQKPWPQICKNSDHRSAQRVWILGQWIILVKALQSHVIQKVVRGFDPCRISPMSPSLGGWWVAIPAPSLLAAPHDCSLWVLGGCLQADCWVGTSEILTTWLKAVTWLMTSLTPARLRHRSQRASWKPSLIGEPGYSLSLPFLEQINWLNFYSLSCEQNDLSNGIYC